ncbi:acyl-CoA dehydrogenase family protein, partial [Nocardia farcinica]|uniref:acyl-CoA dehydrogenase family protein n=1 Tax=Nocardia farcinica TaxID=37329 RepID=UPI0024570E75
MDTVFDHLLTEEPGGPLGSVTEAWERHRDVARRFTDTVDVAVAGGFAADRLGYAFLSGYQAAVAALLPELPRDRPLALAATEEGGGHPAAIRTTATERADGWSVSGTKTFATLGSLARRLVVITSVGAGADGRNRLRAMLVDATAPGVHVTDRPALAFAPEIPHATVTFTDTPATALPGDGYADVLKPFRTVEDIHVIAAAAGWLVRVAREAGWPPPVRQRLLATVAALRGLGAVRPDSPGVHVALGGVLDEFERLLGELAPRWDAVDESTRWGGGARPPRGTGGGGGRGPAGATPG